MIGSKLSHYSILDRIGVGGMSEVYKAFDPRLDRTIALKVLNKITVADEGKRQRFIQEARAASALNHPNILTIYEIGQEGEHHFIATEYIEGQTLREKLQSGALPLQVIFEIAIQVAKALGVAHLAGIVHRDIKPENIMIRPDGYIKVLDFGFAKLMEPALATGATAELRRRQWIVKTEANVVLGTVRYMSPEQVQGLPIDHRCDIFSFGILLYEMLTRQLPFGGQRPIDIAYEIIGVKPIPLTERISGVALELQPIIQRCLEKDPNARYQEMQSIIKDLRQLQRSIDLTQTEPTVVAQGWRDWASGTTSPTRPSLVVLYFENLASDPHFHWWRSAIMELLTLRLLGNTNLEIVGSEQVVDILRQLGQSEEDIDKAAAWEIAQRAGVEICVLGSFMALAGNISLFAHLHEIGSGRLITSLVARRTQPEELFALVDEIAIRIERELKVAREDIEPAAVAALTTNSLVALHAFQTGLEYYRNGRSSAVQEHFQAAITADPQFALAYYYLARVVKCQDKSAYQQYLAGAIERLDHVGGRERLFILLEQAVLHQDYITQLYLAEQLVQQYPREKLGYLFLGQAYHWRGECERAFVIFQQALTLDPRLLFEGIQAGVSTIFESYLDTGRFESAEELAYHQMAANPQNWIAHQLLGIVLYYRHRYTEADAALARAAALNSSSNRYPELWQARIRITEREFEAAEQRLCALLESWQGQERLLCWHEMAETLRERGRIREWFKILNREQEQFAQHSLFDPAFSPRFWRGYFFEQVGELQRALNEYELVLNQWEATAPKAALQSPCDIIDGVWVRVHLSRLLAVCGQFERADELAQQVRLIGRNLPNPKIEQLALYLLGTINFYQGNYESAGELLERSIWSYHNGFSLAILMLVQCLRQLRQYDRALELLDWLEPYGTANNSGRFCSRTQLDLEIAKTYEAAGSTAQAIEFYQRCLEAW
ncbi:MAG: protein kinase, partial [Acidobacteriota bacterium]